METRRIYLALGRAGCGKTRHLSRAVALRSSEMLSAGVRPLVLIHDTRMGKPGSWDENAIGCLAPEDARFPTTSAVAESAEEGNVRPVCSVYQDDALNVMCLAWARCDASESTIVVMDELDQLPEQFRRARPRHRAAYRCLHYGRTHPCDVFATIRQPQRIDSGWFALATDVALFNLSGDLQLTRIRTSGWENADELAKKLPELAEFDYIKLSLPG